MYDRQETWHTSRNIILSLPVIAAVSGLLAFLIPGTDSLWQIALGMIALGVLSAVILSPDSATVVVLFLLYANIPVVAYQFHGFPQVLAGSVVLLLAIPLISIIVIRRQAVIVDATSGQLVLFLIALIASSMVARSLPIATGYTWDFVLEGLLLYLLILNVVRDLSLLRKAIWVILLAGLLMGSLSVYQAVTRSYQNQFGGMAQRVLKYDPTGARYGTEDMAKADRAEGPIGEPNRYGQIMVMLVPLAFLIFRIEKSRVLKAGAFACGGLILGGIVLSYSRGAFLALLLIFVLSAAIGHIRPSQLGGGLMIVLMLLLFVAPGYIGRVSTILGAEGLFSREAEVQPDAVTLGRTTEMLAAFHCALDHPVLGVGPGQYSPFYSELYHQDPEIAFRAIADTRRAHSLYAEMAAETGFIGLLIFLSIPVILLRRLWQLRSRFRPSRPELANLATGFGLAIVAYLATGAFLHLSYQRYYWLMLALSGAAVSILSRETEEPFSEDEE